MSSRGLALAPPAKTVVVYRNGDPFFPGRKFVVNQRRFLTLEAFLNEVTRSIRAPVAVRNLYTPRHGHRVAELGDLRDGCPYVATGFEKFKRLNYLNPRRKELRPTRNAQGWQFHTVAPWKSNVSARWQQQHGHQPRTIRVFRNGDLLSPPFSLQLSKSSALQWDTLLAVLTEKADLQSGAVSKLCRLDGTQVSSGEELGNGSYYVAVGNEEYQKLPYVELLVPQDAACRTLWKHPNNRRKHRSRLDRGRVQTTGAAEEDKVPAVLPLVQRQARRPHLEESPFHAQPIHVGQKRRSNRNAQHWPDTEESVDKATDPRKETQGALEVKEDERSRVDGPTDQGQATGKSQKSVARKRDAGDSQDEKHQTMFPLAAKSSEEFAKGPRWERDS